MFILDVYRFCEMNDKFTRQDLAKFVFRHRECSRLAESAEVTPRFFASSVSKEFLARMMWFGYIDGVRGEYWSKGAAKRPFNFEFRSLEGVRNKYISDIMNLDKLSDEELFGRPKTN